MMHIKIETRWFALNKRNKSDLNMMIWNKNPENFFLLKMTSSKDLGKDSLINLKEKNTNLIANELD